MSRDDEKLIRHAANYGVGDKIKDLIGKTFTFDTIRGDVKGPDFNPFEDLVDPRAQRAVADAIDAIHYSLKDAYIISGLSTGVADDNKLTATRVRAMQQAVDQHMRDIIANATDYRHLFTQQWPTPDPPPMADVLNCNIDWTIIPEDFVIRFGRDIAQTWVNAGNPDRFVFNCSDDIRLGQVGDPGPLHMQQYGIEFIAQRFLERDKDTGEDYFHHLRLVPAGQDDMQKIVAWLVANT